MKASIGSALLLLITVGQISACKHEMPSEESSTSIPPSQAVFKIAAGTVPCTKGSPVGQSLSARCLVVNGQTFHNDIEGYDHQEGTGQTIKIARTQICDPKVFNSCPQDIGSIYRYRLLEIIS